MSFTGLETFDTTFQITNIWLKDVMQELGTDDKRRAFLALRAVLHTLRDRLTIDEAAEFASQLPLLIKGVFYEGWVPSGKPTKDRRREQYVEHVRGYFKNEPDVDAEHVMKAVFAVFVKRISEGEIKDITGIFPRELQDLWPEAVQSRK